MNSPSAHSPKIGIIGLGAIGSLLAQQLSSHFSVCVLPRPADHIRNPCSNNNTRNDTAIQFSVQNLDQQVHDITLPLWQGEPLDLVVICTKAQQSQAALQYWQHKFPKHCQIALLQNGLGQHDQAVKLFPKQTVFAVSTTEGAHKPTVDKVIHAGKGCTQWGYYAGPKQALCIDLASVLGQHLWCLDIAQILRDKLAINCVINALTVKHQCHNGELLTIPEAYGEFQALIHETSNAFNTLHWPLSFDLSSQAHQVASATAGNVSSMLQDVRHHKDTEIDFINGYLLAHAHAIKHPLPLTQALIDAIQTLSITINND